MNKKQLRKRRNEVVDIKIRYCPVTFNEIPRFARNDKACHSERNEMKRKNLYIKNIFTEQQ